MLFLNELRPVYIYPEFDETMELNMAVSPEKIERLLEEHKEGSGCGIDITDI